MSELSGVKAYLPPVSAMLLLVGACLVNPPVLFTHWGKSGATSQRLHLFALECFRHLGRAVPLQVGLGLAYVPMISCGSGAYSDA